MFIGCANGGNYAAAEMLAVSANSMNVTVPVRHKKNSLSTNLINGVNKTVILITV